MKKTISILLMLLVALSALPAVFAEETNQNSTTTDVNTEHNETEDTNNDNEDKEEIEIEAEVENGETEVKVKTESLKTEFTTNTTDREGLVSEIMAKTGLSREQIEANLKLETEDDKGKTEKELHAMDSLHGATMRLLQLEKSIDRNIAQGKKVIEVLGNSTNTTDLSAIVAEMEALKDEVHKADPEAADAVQKFVDLKSDARDLAKQFRDKVRGLLTEEQKKLVRKAKHAEEKELEGKIKEQLRAFNSERMRDLLKASGLDDEVLLAKIKSGEITAKEVQELMKDKIKAMDKQHKKDLQKSLKELKIKQAVAAKAKAEEMKMGSMQRKEGRLQERLKNLEQKGMKLENMEKYTQMRLKQLEDAKDRLEDRKGGRK